MAKLLVFIIAVLAVVPVFAQEADTAEIKPPVPEDSVRLDGDTLTLSDTLTEAQKAEILFNERYKQYRDEQKEAYIAPFSYFDSLVASFTSSRQNKREPIDRAYYHDAGDYFRRDPGYLVLEPQVMPMRKTVQPYGLAGDRMNVLIDRNQIKPFDWVVEPDGLMDFNDIPTALDHDVYILPGPVGSLFGGEQMVATLLTRPEQTDKLDARSTFLVDKGSFGFSNARGRYSKNFISGRKIDMSIGYRVSDGMTLHSGDDAYHYYGDFYFPVKCDYAFRATGQLYNREGYLNIRPDSLGNYVKRNRFDRFVRLSFSSSNKERTTRNELSYKHLRQGSDLNKAYYGRYNLTGHGLVLTREWNAWGHLFKIELTGDYLLFDDGYDEFNRLSSSASFNLASLKSSWKYALRTGQKHDEQFRFLPFASALLYRTGHRFLAMFSAGYGERAPSLLEQNLRVQQVSLYGASYVYRDSGNKDLVSEKQLTGNVTLEYGSTDNALGVEVTGGKITDGIDWRHTVESNVEIFKPVNGNINFVNTSLTGRIRLGDFIRFNGGGAYHYLDYETEENQPYAPEYQGFAGAELHLFWKQKLIDLFAYGELVYVGPYDGYIDENLGDALVFNAKLSFKMGSFRFHYVIQNVTSVIYADRDYSEFSGRYHYYGFTWDFLD
ncbi:MAG: hypothetical protein ACOYVF_11080 [Candidatus Zixiibacteriota bacterium]